MLKNIVIVFFVFIVYEGICVLCYKICVYNWKLIFVFVVVDVMLKMCYVVFFFLVCWFKRVCCVELVILDIILL